MGSIIAREGDEIVLKLSTGERIMAVHRDVRVPLSAVKSVVFSGYWPGWLAYGAKYTRLIVSLDQPDAAKTALTA